MSRRFDRWKRWAAALRTETYALYLACRDPRTPWAARVFGMAVVAYALSPIDLIPDFIPVLGYLDDLILIPLGFLLLLKLVPREVLVDCRRRAEEAFRESRPRSRVAACVVIGIWVVTIPLVVCLFTRYCCGLKWW